MAGGPGSSGPGTNRPGTNRPRPPQQSGFKGSGAAAGGDRRADKDPAFRKPKFQKPASSGSKGRREAPGMAARQLAVSVLVQVLNRGQSLDETLASLFASERGQALEPRDKGIARLIATTVLRRSGELGAAVRVHLDKPLPDDSGRLWTILLSAAAQLLVLETPPHAAINLAVDQVRADREAARFDGLTNAVLRRVSERGLGGLAARDAARLNVPAWMFARWVEAYGAETAYRIAEASLREAALDLTVKADPQKWADALGGIVLQTGSVRVAASGRIEDLPGYADGAWWVQDAAAALPAALLGNIAGKNVADLCAAPGGKTAQLVNAGAHVTAVDLRPERLKRLDQNMERLGLACETVAADAGEWAPDRLFDAVLLDAPCTATGTIRRHPDILHLKRETDATQLEPIQARLLANAARLVRPGGTLMYCTCSLDLAEGEWHIKDFLIENAEFERLPIGAGEAGVDAAWVTPEGDLRTLPFHLPLEGLSPNGEPVPGGLDGFYAARLTRKI
jgi:16S rRNA (cytosine967-C5)-methyltransferase